MVGWASDVDVEEDGFADFIDLRYDTLPRQLKVDYSGRSRMSVEWLSRGEDRRHLP